MFFQILTYIKFRQTNAISYNFFTQSLCWEYYSKQKDLVVIQFIKYPNFEFKSWKKKTWQISESRGCFQILTHDNYEQTNGIQLEFFYTSPMLGILQQTEGGINVIKDSNFESKNWKEKNP